MAFGSQRKVYEVDSAMSDTLAGGRARGRTNTVDPSKLWQQNTVSLPLVVAQRVGLRLVAYARWLKGLHVVLKV